MPRSDEEFERPEIIRPPSERSSYFLPLTRGCSNNTCAFCGYYGFKLGIRDVEDVKREIDALALFDKSRVALPSVPDIVYLVAEQWDRKRIFLQDGDALVYPYDKLVELLRYLNDKLPRLERVSTYATPQDILRRSREELETLRDLKLGILYTGVESGDDEVLKSIEKGATHAEMVEAGQKVKEAGILFSVTVILGLGGVEGSERHVAETARVLTEIDPDYAGALTLTLVPNTPLHEKTKRGAFHPIDPFQSLAELRDIVEQSSFSDCFFSSMHASNYFAIRGRLPGEKQRVLRQLDEVLAARNPGKLRPEFLRGL